MEKVLELLEELKDSPISNEDYFLTTMNLCGAVHTIADSISDLVSTLEDHRKKTGVVLEHFFDWIRERTWQIQSISEAIEGRLQNGDFAKFTDLVFHYKELHKDKK